MISELAKKYNLTNELTQMVYDAFCQTGNIDFEWFMVQKMWDGATLGDWLKTASSITQQEIREFSN